MKLICGRTTFIPRSCVSTLDTRSDGVSSHSITQRTRAVARNGLSDDETRRLLEACQGGGFVQLRDQAMMAHRT